MEGKKQEHNIPLSFGLTARKRITSRLALETGLVYTYLSSKFWNENNSEPEIKQELHYLGIPLNVVFYLYENERFSIYGSAGGMVEKGLKQKYTQRIQHNNVLDNAVMSSTVKGLQWSVGASVGASYKLTPKWNVYFEPRYSYYFDNNQPLSASTKYSNSFGITAGIGYEF